MPLLRTETIHGWPCKFYDNGRVNVGTRAADRFTINLPADEEPWFSTKLRAELIERELATAEELPVDEAGEAAMAAKAAAKEHKTVQSAAAKKVAASTAAKEKAAAAVEAGKYDESMARLKRKRAENTHIKAKMAAMHCKVEQLAQSAGPVHQPLLTEWLAKHTPPQ